MQSKRRKKNIRPGRMVYFYTGDKEMVALSKKLANYFLNRLPEDAVCHWDLALVGTDALRDSSSAAIAVCGLLELVKHLPVTDPDRERYQQWAMGIMSSLTKHYLIDLAWEVYYAENGGESAGIPTAGTDAGTHNKDTG